MKRTPTQTPRIGGNMNSKAEFMIRANRRAYMPAVNHLMDEAAGCVHYDAAGRVVLVQGRTLAGIPCVMQLAPSSIHRRFPRGEMTSHRTQEIIAFSDDFVRRVLGHFPQPRCRSDVPAIDAL